MVMQNVTFIVFFKSSTAKSIFFNILPVVIKVISPSSKNTVGLCILKFNVSLYKVENFYITC